MPSNSDQHANTIRVKLIKQENGGLGFLVKQRMNKPFVVVADLVSGGIAEESGLVQVGDVILRINDIDLTDMSYESSVEILKAVPVNAPVVLLLRGPEGFSSHLETTFLENGMPTSARVTKPIDNTIVGRIRRTLASTPSPLSSPVRTLKQLCNGDDSGGKGGRKNSKKKAQVTESVGNDTEFNIDSHQRDANTQTLEQQKTSLVNGDVVRAKNDDNFEETVLDNGCQGSPKIILSSPTLLSNGPLKKRFNSENGDIKAKCQSPSRRAIEIIQDNDEITVVVKGDIKIKNDSDNGSYDNTPKRVVIGGSSTREIEGSSNGQSPENGESIRPASCDHVDVSDDEGKKMPSEKRKNGSLTNTPRRGGERRASATPSPKKYTKLRNLLDDKTDMDVLHHKSAEPTQCTPERCMGSLMDMASKRPPGIPRSKEELITQAKSFIEQYYASIKRINTPSHQKRSQEVLSSIEKSGSYDLTTSELTFGAKTAWRNAARCIGRIQWTKLQVFDARHITTARGMFEAICNHIKYATNKGNIRSAITIFPQRTVEKKDFRVWNAQLVRYAGYKQPDGSVIGDPSNVEFTEICIKMGWKPKGGMFDIVPLILSAGGHDPEMFEVPPELILEVQIKHPKYPWFSEMGLKWYALPAVSAMLFDCGGLEFTACPFNGWYMGTEIGARDFCDVNRYNIIENVAKQMGLDTRKSSSLWKDRALVEVNIAVLHSFQTSGATITDHHSASESFMKHLENEQRLRGGCPADWVWVVPPMSGSLTQVFHQEMLLYKLKPSYEYQEEAWKTHIWKKDRDKTKSSDRPKRKFGFKELARAVKFSAKLMGKALARRVKCTILYATETGKSERFARTLCEIFKHAFDAKVVCMDEYDVTVLEHENLVLIITSTFGNGDPPENGEIFAKSLFEIKTHDESSAESDFKSSSYIRMSSSSDKSIKTAHDNKGVDEKHGEDDNLYMETGPLANVRFSVFGLGSRAYPNFCAFANYMDKMLSELGSERIYKMGEGDELCGQEESFRNWAQEVFKSACEVFCLGDDVNMSEATGALSSTDHTWQPDKFRLTPMDNEKEIDLCEALSKLHSKTILPCKMMERKQLQSTESNRETILLKMDTQGASELLYMPGDHAGIFPANNPELVAAILARLHNSPPPDQLIRLEFLTEKNMPLGTIKSWGPYEKMPVCTLKTAFTRFLDVTTPPSQSLLQSLAAQASRDTDREQLELLATESNAYEDWKYDRMPNLLEVLEEFPSLRVPPSLLMTQLPNLQQRFYSISSSPKVYPGEIHATIAVVTYRTQDGAGPVHEGVCSSWLNRCEQGEVIPCAVRGAPSFRLPDDNTLPIVMVGPGTGIAPFRSFWQQRKIDREMEDIPCHGDKKGWGEMELYFGCRNSKIDNIYSDELTQMKAEKVLNNFYVALSREPDVPKTYVQDDLKVHSEKVYRAIVKEGGHFYVCGDVSMASDVTTTLEKILQECGGMKSEVAKNFILKLRDANRFHEDIFGVSIQKRSTESDKPRDQGQRAWKYISSAGKPNKPDTVKEIATPIPAPANRAPTTKPKAPPKNVFQKNNIDTDVT
ncbi:nitric oxide synthase, brain [Patella vulgata]|uniref:nitric oxide synthase, brain n=1 Tax=Patella vulgata TaxID=6465 RepID=UPI00218005DF|nr:nitric oxide synthase, brain [Patella vulgata]